MKTPPKRGCGFRRRTAFRQQAPIARVLSKYTWTPTIKEGGPLHAANKAHAAFILIAFRSVFRSRGR